MGKLDVCFSLVLLLSPIWAFNQEVSFTPVNSFQLADPQVEVDSILFQEGTQIRLKLDHPGVSLHYTLDGSDVTPQAQKYNKPIPLNQSAILKVKAFHDEFYPSRTLVQGVYKVNDIASSAKVKLSANPHKNYAGNGVASLVDLKKGSTNFRVGNYWLGFQERELLIELEFEKPISIHSLSMSTLEDHGSWIFLPKAIEVYSENELLAQKDWNKPPAAQPKALHFLQLDWPKQQVKAIQIKIKNLPFIPDWHQGKGTTPWLFLDELLIE